jgi:hypothetical protein
VYDRIGQSLLNREPNLKALLFGNPQPRQGFRYGIHGVSDRLGIRRHAAVEQFRERFVIRVSSRLTRHRGQFSFANPTIEIVDLNKRFHRGGVVIENLEQVKNTHQAQSLHREFVGLDEFDVPTTLLG